MDTLEQRIPGDLIAAQHWEIAKLEAELAALKEAAKPFVSAYRQVQEGQHPIDAPNTDDWALYTGYRTSYAGPQYLLNLTADCGPQSWELMRGTHLRALAEAFKDE